MRCPSDVQLVMSSQCGLQGEAGLETLRPSFLVGMVGKVLTLRDGTKDWVWPQQPQVGKMRRNRARKMRGGGRGADGRSSCISICKLARVKKTGKAAILSFVVIIVI